MPYVVFVGAKPGIYDDWTLCQRMVDSCKNNVFCKFDSRSKAEIAYKSFLDEEAWCTQNPGNVCRGCNGLTKLKISKQKPRCGMHYYECTNKGCSQMLTWVKDLMMRKPPDVDGGNNASCSQSSLDVDLQALVEERDRAIEERNKAIGQLDSAATAFQSLVHERDRANEERDLAINLLKMYKDMMHGCASMGLND